MASESTTPPKATVRKIGDRWRASCPCGYFWSTKHFRLALKFCTAHTHVKRGWAVR